MSLNLDMSESQVEMALKKAINLANKLKFHPSDQTVIAIAGLMLNNLRGLQIVHEIDILSDEISGIVPAVESVSRSM